MVSSGSTENFLLLLILEGWLKRPNFQISQVGVLLEHSCLKLLLHPKFQDTNFCCLNDPEVQFCKEMGNRTMHIGLALQEGYTNVRNVIVRQHQGVSRYRNEAAQALQREFQCYYFPGKMMEFR